ncbi:MAG: alpha/beta fold hydrolase [Bauldia litoralis]
MPYCEVEAGVCLYYESFGSGAPVVFIHGGGTSHETWEQQTGALFERFHTVAYDLRGHGASDKPAHGHTFDGLVEDLEALLAHLGLDRVALVCHAIGGYVGMKFALKRPEALSGLVLVDSSARFLGDDEERGGFSIEFFENLLSTMAADKVGATVRLIDDYFFHRDPGPAVKQVILQEMLQWPLAATKMLSRDAVKFDLVDRLGDIKAPTLVAHGRHDRKQRFGGAQLIADGIPDARLVVFEESAHLPYVEEAGRFNETLADFLEGLDGRAAEAAE